MWIILEGPDGAGKTTLAARLTEAAYQLGIRPETKHLGPPANPQSAMAECLDVLDDLDQDASVISDRHHFGCPVYGPIYRPTADLNGYGDMGKHGWRYVDMVAAANGALVVYCRATVDELTKRLEGRGDDYIDVAHLPDIVRLYEWIMPQTTCGLVSMDATKLDDEEVRRLVIKAHAVRELAKSAQAFFRGTIAGNAMVARDVRPLSLLEDPVKTVAELGNDRWSNTLLVRGDAARRRETTEQFEAWLDARYLINAGAYF